MAGKVVHVLRKYDPAEWGGTETLVAAVTSRLGSYGWPCEVHAPRGPRTADGALAPEVPLRRYRSFLPFVGPASRRRALVANGGNIVSLHEPVRLMRDRRARLAHLHTLGRVGGGVRTAMRLTHRPYVISVHGPLLAQRGWLAQDTRRRAAGTLDLGKPFGAVLGSRRVLDDAARVIAFNREEHRALRARVGARAVRMDHGVEVERFEHGDARRAARRWPSLRGGPVIVVVGRLCEQKNQVLAVRALATGAPPEAQLALAGATTDLGYRDQVVDEARRLGVADRVHVLGNLSAGEEVPDLYALATLVLVPSVQEAFGLVVLEAMAAGRPVIFGAHSGMTDIAQALGYPASNPHALEARVWAAAVGRFLDDPALRRSAADAGLGLVTDHYSWDRVASDLASLYEEVVEEHSR